ncbi:MAG: ACT domain-containing protein [Bacteroidetes bacterium]|nr:ACT domain-containing protein [Bacteroidota bacterium]
MKIKQLSIFLENKSGRLSEVTETLASAKINISAFSVADTADYGILRMIVSKPEQAEQLLKAKGLSVHITEVIGIVVPNEPGGLHRALQILSSEGISVEYMYAFALSDRATVIIRTEAVEQTISAFQKHKMELVKASDIYEI